jgi:hypothetical protein
MTECPKRQKKRRLVYVMTTYLRQHGLMSFISLNIPEREINLHFVNSAGLIFQSIPQKIFFSEGCKMVHSAAFWI